MMRKRRGAPGVLRARPLAAADALACSGWSPTRPTLLEAVGRHGAGLLQVLRQTVSTLFRRFAPSRGRCNASKSQRSPQLLRPRLVLSPPAGHVRTSCAFCPRHSPHSTPRDRRGRGVRRHKLDRPTPGCIRDAGKVLHLAVLVRQLVHQVLARAAESRASWRHCPMDANIGVASTHETKFSTHPRQGAQQRQ